MGVFDKFRKKTVPQEDLFEGKKPINSKSIEKAMAVFQEYHDGKRNLEERIRENERFWKRRQYVYEDSKESWIPASAHLWNCIVNKHAQLVEAYPSFNILPQEADDINEAEILSKIVPIVFRQNNYKDTYSRTSLYKVKQGTGITGVFWDSQANNGLGEIVISKADILNLFWAPGVDNIQDSPHFFSVSLVDTELLEEAYPEHKNRLGRSSIDIAEYDNDENVDTSKKSLVIDWYYKKVIDGRLTVQLCKFVNSTILYATENETDPVTDEDGNVIRESLAKTGLYADAKYPYVFDPLFVVEGTPAGEGYTDVGKDIQIQIDLLNNAITENAMRAAKTRYLYSATTGINGEEFADWSKDAVRVESTDLSDAAVRELKTDPLGGVYLEILASRINELKETLGNRDVNTGGTVSGVTAASALAVMQEAGGRIDRAKTLETYNAQEQIAQMVISRIQEFYSTSRIFRILDDDNEIKFLEYKSKIDTSGFPKLPFFDIEITAEKAAPYKAISQNELMLQFYSARFFDPANAQPALACLSGMDFDGKDNVAKTIRNNNTIIQQLLKLATIVDATYGTNLTSQISASPGGPISIPNVTPTKAEPKHIRNAREYAQEVSQP